MCKERHTPEMRKMQEKVEAIADLLADLNKDVRLSSACGKATSSYREAGQSILDGILMFELRFVMFEEDQRRIGKGESPLSRDDLGSLIERAFTPEMAHHIARMGENVEEVHSGVVTFN